MNLETAILYLATFDDAELVISTSGEVKVLQYETLATEYTVSKVYFGGRQVVAEWRPDVDGESWQSTPIPRKWDWED
jgi:hypothetical protein